MILNRESLKQLFRKGKAPSENHFAHLIDSSLNKMEDGIGKTAAEGLQLSPQGAFDQVLSVYERMDLPLPSWQIKLLRENEARGLSFEKVEKDEDNNPTTTSRLFLANEGNIGVHTTQPWAPFHVATTAGLKARVGTHVYGQVPGDGEWHPILSNLSGLQSLEVMTRIEGPPGRGKYAQTHAFALRAFGGKQSKRKIPQTRAYYGFFWNRLELRWAGSVYDYSLEVRTRQHYGFDEDGNQSMIKFHVTNLWDDSLFNNDELPEFHPAQPTDQA